MSSNRIKSLENAVKLIQEEAIENSFSYKREFVLAFLNQRNRNLNSVERLVELDLSESLWRYYKRIEALGQLCGLLTVVGSWHSILGRMYPLSKLLLGGIVVHLGGELSLYKHIDMFYRPIKQLKQHTPK